MSGFVTIEPYAFLGVNATLRDDITIAEATLVGAGAAIMRDTKPYEVHVPAPTRTIDVRSDAVGL